MIVQTPLFNDKMGFSFCFHRKSEDCSQKHIHCLCWVRKPIIEIVIIVDKLCWHFFYHSVGRLLDFSHFTWWYSASIHSSDLAKWDKMFNEKKKYGLSLVSVMINYLLDIAFESRPFHFAFFFGGLSSTFHKVFVTYCYVRHNWVSSSLKVTGSRLISPFGCEH